MRSSGILNVFEAGMFLMACSRPLVIKFKNNHEFNSRCLSMVCHTCRKAAKISRTSHAFIQLTFPKSVTTAKPQPALMKRGEADHKNRNVGC